MRPAGERFKERLVQRAHELGFRSVGICAAGRPPRWDAFVRWLEAGRAGTMEYLPRRRDAYAHPRHVLEGCRTLVMLTLDYRTAAPPAVPAGSGRVAAYAWGQRDYHDVVHGKLKELAAWWRREDPAAHVRGVVDTAPLLEREFARLAGLGWIGKHTLLLHRDRGSWFFLAALLSDGALPPDEAFDTDYCGSCRACLDACPTDAFPAPYELDPRRCISYLTIEHRGPIPESLRSGMGDWVFGCDVCQDVCPWNRRAPWSEVPEFAPREDLYPLDLVTLFDEDDETFRARFRKTPLWRARRQGLLRNAAIVLGNRPAPHAVSALLKGLQDDDPVVRGACAWALRSYEDARVDEALRRRLAEECDGHVIDELHKTLAQRRE